MGVVLPWSLAGTPVMHLPVGLNADRLPLIGKRPSEMSILQMAYAHEQATPFDRKQLPPIPG